LVEMLRTWHARGRALVLISHDLQLPAALGGRVIALRAGRVAADGAAEAILVPSCLATIYDTHFEIAETASGQKVILPDWWQTPRASLS
jgi:iron complex transport system ATP-binding protein